MAEPNIVTEDDLRRIIMGCTDRCQDVAQHDFYVNGGGFVWRRPQVTIYRPADKSPRATWNRYPHNVIGAAVVLFGRCWGVTWKGSPPRGNGARKRRARPHQDGRRDT